MPMVLPYLALMALLRWIAVVVSAALLVTLYRDGQLSGKSLGIHVSWFGAAAGLQFLTSSPGLTAAGLLLQSALAVYLILRWRFNSI